MKKPIIFITWLLALQAEAAIHFVLPGESIQAVIDSAQTRDSVVLHEGTYVESIVPYGKVITLASLYLLDHDSSHIASTIIRADTIRPDTNSCIAYVYGEAPGNRVVGLHLTGGRGTNMESLDYVFGGSVCIRPSTQYSSVEIDHCLIDSSRAEVGGGVSAYGFDWAPGTHLIVRNSIIRECAAELWGGGVYAAYCSLSVLNTTIDSDSSELARPGGIDGGYPYTRIDSCIIRNCSGHGIGGVGISGGIGIVSSCTFQSNYILGLRYDNHLTVGHGTFDIHDNWFGPAPSPSPLVSFCCQDTDVRFTRNVVEGHHSSLQGYPYIITVAGITGEIAYNLFLENSSELMGLLYCFQETTVRIHHNEFWGNSNLGLPQGCVVTTGPNGHPTLDSNLIAGNMGPTVAYYQDFPTTIDARNNWWGDGSGPYHPTLNPGGRGDTLLSDSVLFEPWLASPSDTTIDFGGMRPVIVRHWQLTSIYPNPFNGAISIEIDGSTGEDFLVTLHNTLGQEVAVLQRGRVLGSFIHYTADQSLSAGIYFVRLADASNEKTAKVLFLK